MLVYSLKKKMHGGVCSVCISVLLDISSSVQTKAYKMFHKLQIM